MSEYVPREGTSRAPAVVEVDDRSAPETDIEPGSSVDRPLVSTAHKERLGVPPAVFPRAIRWEYVIGISAVHLLSLLAFVPWLFSWTGVILVFVGQHIFSGLGISIGYHRLLTHRGFACPRWFEHFLALLGICCLQDSPARWVAIHRQHHQHSDTEPDPHTPRVNFFWSHVGWLFLRNHDHERAAFFDRYAKDLLRDPFYMYLERRGMWMWVYTLHALLIFLLGMVVGWLVWGDYRRGVQFGASWLVWGVFVRTVFVWHGTWAVNSVTHLWGYRNYATNDDSRNNWAVALISHGEGWHNNHHAEPRAAAHGHRWWEFDLSWLLIRMLERVGFVRDVVRPRAWARGTAIPPRTDAP